MNVSKPSRHGKRFLSIKVPDAWGRYLAFNAIHTRQQAGLDGDPRELVVPACVVLPMGWSSSVGLMQMASRELIRRSMTLDGMELRRQVVAPPWFVDLLQRSDPKHFWQVYLDNYMAASMSKDNNWKGSQARHGEAVQAWTQAGVLCAEDKHVLGAQQAIELGVVLDGKSGLMGGSGPRLHQLLAMTLVLLGHKAPTDNFGQMGVCASISPPHDGSSQPVLGLLSGRSGSA